MTIKYSIDDEVPPEFQVSYVPGTHYLYTLPFYEKNFCLLNSRAEKDFQCKADLRELCLYMKSQIEKILSQRPYISQAATGKPENEAKLITEREIAWQIDRLKFILSCPFLEGSEKTTDIIAPSATFDSCFSPKHIATF